MDWTSLVGPAVVSAFVSAFVSGVISIVGMFVNRSTTIKVNEKKIKADIDLAEKKFDFDKQMAQHKFDLDKAQLIHKRRFELAESLLSDAYRFRDIMAYVRNGGASGNEGNTRKPEEGESENLKRTKDNYFVPIERIQKENEFISNLFAKKNTAFAHFGEEVIAAFRNFDWAIVEVQTAARCLIRGANSPSRDEDFNTRMEMAATIYFAHHE